MTVEEIINRDGSPCVLTNEELTRRMAVLVEIIDVLSDRVHALDGREWVFTATTRGNKLESVKP